MAQQRKFDIALPRPRKPVVLPPPPIKNDNHIININIDGNGGGGGGSSASDLVVLSSIQSLTDQLAELSQNITVIQEAQNHLTDGQKEDVLELISEHVTDTLDLSALNNSIVDLNDDF